MNAYYIQDRLEAQSWARHYQQIAREEKEAELADDMERLHRGIERTYTRDLLVEVFLEKLSSTAPV